ncbi:hypothetical protein BN1708_019624, partial [Verticillium longisporum]
RDATSAAVRRVAVERHQRPGGRAHRVEPLVERHQARVVPGRSQADAEPPRGPDERVWTDDPDGGSAQCQLAHEPEGPPGQRARRRRVAGAGRA